MQEEEEAVAGSTKTAWTIDEERWDMLKCDVDILSAEFACTVWLVLLAILELAVVMVLDHTDTFGHPSLKCWWELVHMWTEWLFTERTDIWDIAADLVEEENTGAMRQTEPTNCVLFEEELDGGWIDGNVDGALVLQLVTEPSVRTGGDHSIDVDGLNARMADLWPVFGETAATGSTASKKLAAKCQELALQLNVRLPIGGMHLTEEDGVGATLIISLRDSGRTVAITCTVSKMHTAAVLQEAPDCILVLLTGGLHLTDLDTLSCQRTDTFSQFGETAATGFIALNKCIMDTCAKQQSIVWCGAGEDGADVQPLVDGELNGDIEVFADIQVMVDEDAQQTDKAEDATQNIAQFTVLSLDGADGVVATNDVVVEFSILHEESLVIQDMVDVDVLDFDNHDDATCVHAQSTAQWAAGEDGDDAVLLAVGEHNTDTDE